MQENAQVAHAVNNQPVILVDASVKRGGTFSSAVDNRI